MHNGDLKLAFLGRVQQSIGCWQPTLEQKFRVALGNVQAKPLIVRDFVNTIIERARTQSALSSPPRSSRFKHLLFELERRTVWLPPEKRNQDDWRWLGPFHDEFGEPEPKVNESERRKPTALASCARFPVDGGNWTSSSTVTLPQRTGQISE